MSPAWIVTPGSSNVRRFTYVEGLMILAVEFHGEGQTYIYVGIPEAVAKGLAMSPSKGQFVHTHLKGRYPYYSGDVKAGKYAANIKTLKALVHIRTT